MIVITDGHCYELSNFEKPIEQGQVIQFIHKAPVSENSTELETVTDGTTNEEVVEMLINRIQFLQSKFPCRENSLALTKLQEANFWLHERTKNRILRGVNDKAIV